MPTKDWSPALNEYGGNAWAPSITSIDLLPPGLSGDALDNQTILVKGNGSPGAIIELEYDGALIKNANVVDNSGNWGYSLAVSIGTHTIRARQIIGGETSDWSVQVTLVVSDGKISAWGSAIKGQN